MRLTIRIKKVDGKRLTVNAAHLARTHTNGLVIFGIDNDVWRCKKRNGVI